MKTKQILTAGAIALSMILTGCSASSTGTKDTKTTEVAKKKEVKTIGQKTKDSKSLKMTNNTGKKITVFETKSSSEESFSGNLLDNGDAVKKQRRTYFVLHCQRKRQVGCKSRVTGSGQNIRIQRCKYGRYKESGCFFKRR